MKRRHLLAASVALGGAALWPEARLLAQQTQDFIEGLNMLGNLKLGSSVPGQWAIQTALGGYQSINDLVSDGGRLRRQRDLAHELITAIPGVVDASDREFATRQLKELCERLQQK